MFAATSIAHGVEVSPPPDAQPVLRQPDQPRVVERAPVDVLMPADGGATRGAGAVAAFDPSVKLRPDLAETVPPTVRTELIGERTEHSRITASPDGTYTLEASPGRLHYRDAAGTWQPLDLSLIESLVDGYDLRVAANDREVRFGNRDAEEALAQVGGDGQTVGIRALDFPSSLVPEEPAEPAPTASPTPSPTEPPPSPSPTAAPTPAPSPSAEPSTAASAEPSPSEAPPTPSATPPPSPTPTAEPTRTPPPAPTPVPSPTEPAGPVSADNRLVFEKDAATGRVIVGPTDDGFEFSAVLANGTQSNRYSFAVDVGTLAAALAGDGSITLSAEPTGDTQGLLGVIRAPVLYDDSQLRAPLNAIHVDLYRPGVNPTPPAGVSPAALAALGPNEVVVTYTIDASWLADPVRQFPVTLDPTVCVRVGDSGCDQGQDYVEHYVASGIPNTYPVLGSWLRAGYSDAADGFQNMRSLLFFDNVALGDGAHITKATLTLREDDNRDASTSPDIQARLINKGWATNSTWNQLAAGFTATYNSPAVDPCSTGATDCDVVLDVAKVVRAWYTRRGLDWKPNIGFQVAYVTENSSEKETRFYRATSGTIANRPKLTITYQISKVKFDFAPELGVSYSPSTMVADQATRLPVKFTNDGSDSAWNNLLDAGSARYRLGYRWFDGKGKTVDFGAQDLAATVNIGSNTGVVALDIEPPETPGQYTLRLDLVHEVNGINVWTSDWAAPTLYYSRNKKVLKSDATRWVGTSVIERADFPINVVRGSGDAVGELRTVTLGDGSTLGLNLYSHDVRFEGAGGIGFDDLIPVGVEYGYDYQDTRDCATSQSPTLRTGTTPDFGCGWYTNWDERLTPGATAGAYVYQGPSGNRYFADTDGTGQLVSNAPVLLERARYTIFDEHKLPASAATVITASGSPPSWSGSQVLEAPSNDHKGVGTFGTIDLNTYWYVRFAARTSVVGSAGLAVKIHNLSNPGDFPDRWIVLTLGTDWTTTYDQQALGQSIVNAWRYYDYDLYTRIKGDADFGAPTDSYQVTAVQIQSSSAGNSGSTYVDGLRFEAIDSGVLVESRPSFTANPSNAIDWTDVPTLPISNAYSVKVPATPLNLAPACANPCMSAPSGDLFARPFVSWWWKKVGGTAVAIEFNLKDLRTSTTGKITYYAGPVPPPGAHNPIQVSTDVPAVWTRVVRNVLDDGRSVLNFYNDAPVSTSPGSPPSQGPVPDEVKWIGYTLWAVDGNHAIFDHLRYTSAPNTGEASAGHPNAAGDTTDVFDFEATYADGSRHLFNGDGLLERIVDRDNNEVELDWTLAAQTEGQTAYTLGTIHAPSDGGSYDREIARTTPSGKVTFTEKVGATGSTGRSMSFSINSNDDVTRVQPARTPTCGAAEAPSGCLELTYTGSGLHKLQTLFDPRDTSSVDWRTEIMWDAIEGPLGIRDLAPNPDAYLVRVLDYDTGASLPSAKRVLWQDAAAIRVGYGIYTDLSSDGSIRLDYIPLACSGGDCVTNPPSTGSLATSRRSANEFDGLARASKAITYVTTGASPPIVVSRQGTKAGAKVDNYVDPLTSGQIEWTQSPDQYFTSVKMSGANSDADLYRTFHRYDEDGNEVAVADPAWNTRPSYAGVIQGTLHQTSLLKGYWRLGETSGTTATDLASSPHHGTYVGGVGLGSTGALVNDASTAASFDGSNDVVTIPSVGTISGSFTVAAWARPETTSVPISILGTRSGADFSFDMKFQAGTTVHGDIGSGTAWLTTTADAPLRYEIDRWYHIVYVVTSTGYTIYIDGAPMARGSFAGTPLFADGTRLLRIGNNGRTTTSIEWFDGRIDDVAVYSQALTGPQVQAQYLAGRSVAVATTNTLYDDKGHPIQVDDQFLASPGFESGTGDWDLSATTPIGQIHLATSETDTNVHQPLDPEAPHSWASFRTGTNGSARQDVALVPGQTFRFQVYEKTEGASGNPYIIVRYWQRSSGTWVDMLANVATRSSSWVGHAWDLTLPLDTDGRIRVVLAATGSPTNVYYDTVAVLTTYARSTYLLSGLPDTARTFTPGGGNASAEIALKSTYASATVHPAIFPTTSIANYVDGSYDPAEPDTDVTSTTTYDAWGRPLVATDPDGVATETSYATSGNGAMTDVASTKDGLLNPTTYAYDLVGNRTSVDPPVVAATTTTYDHGSRPIQTTPPSPGTPSVNEYDAQGFLTRTIANYVNGTGSGASGLDDVATSFTYDAFGQTLTTIGNAGIDLGPATKTSVETYDLLGNPTAASIWSTHTLQPGGQGTFGAARQTTAYHELNAGIARPAIAAARGPGSLVPTGAPAPLCPDGGSTRCNSVTGFDLRGQAITVTDAYGKVARRFLDLAGRPVFTIANYVDGVYASSAPDTDLVTTTRYDILGQTDEAIDVLGRSTNASFDGLGRSIASHFQDDTATAIAKTRTIYTAGGRVDRASGRGAEGDADSALPWTKTVYDRAGRATTTLANWNVNGEAGLAVDSFEAPVTDDTIANDGIAESWATTGTFISAGGSITRETAVSLAVAGGARLKVNGNVANGGTEWKLDGTYRGTGAIYKARVWVHAPSGLAVSGRLGFSTGDASSVVNVTGNGAFQALDLTWDPTADRTNVRLAVYVGSASSSNVYLDDAVVWNSSNPNVNVPTETAYDAASRVVASILPPGVPGTTGEEPMVTRTAYDDLGRVTTITATEIAGGGTPGDANLDTETTYDALGRTSTVLDPTNTVTRYDYDRLGRLTGTWANRVDGTPSDGATVDDDVHSTFAYNAAGELIRYCPAKQVILSCNVDYSAEDQAWHYAFDDAGHLVTQTPPDNAVVTDLARRFWTYDAGGRLTNVCDDQATTCGGGSGGGRHSVPTYDAVGRVTRLDTYNSATGSTLALRTDTTYLGDGQVKQTKASEGPTPTLIDTIDATFDGLGRPDQLKRSTTVLADFNWNADGTLASRVDGDGGAIGTTTFAYDWADRLISANLPDTFSTAVPTFAWRADGLIKSRTYDTGSAASFTYDRAKRPTTIAKGTLTLEQAYDRDGNVTSESRSLGFSGDAGTNTQTFSYDGLSRVLSSTGLGTGHNFTYEYDHDGNRTKKADGTTTWTYGYDRTDQLSSTTGGPTIVAYNAFGDMTSKPEDTVGSTSWTYDYAGKLTSINGPGSGDDASFTFDALGRFKTRVLASSTDTYSYLGTSETVIRVDSTLSGADIDSIITSAGDRLGVDAGATMNWFLPDLHGSVAASLSADESTVTNAIRYDPWGDTLVTGSGGGTAVGADKWKYQGRLDLSPAGIGEPLYDMSARFYAPSLGVFTQLDSVIGSAQNPLSMNRFLYAHANPASLIDPSGHAAANPCRYGPEDCAQIANGPGTKPAAGPGSGGLAGPSAVKGKGKSKGKGHKSVGAHKAAVPPAGPGGKADKWWNDPPVVSRCGVVDENGDCLYWNVMSPDDATTVDRFWKDNCRAEIHCLLEHGDLAQRPPICLGCPPKNDGSEELAEITAFADPTGVGSLSLALRDCIQGNQDGCLTNLAGGIPIFGKLAKILKLEKGFAAVGRLLGLGTEARYFRGAEVGQLPNFVPLEGQYKLDKATGLVRDTHGISVFDNPESVRGIGMVPYQVDLGTIDPRLRIIQRGRDPRHYEIVPAQGANLTEREYINLCSLIDCH